MKTIKKETLIKCINEIKPLNANINNETTAGGLNVEILETIINELKDQVLFNYKDESYKYSEHNSDKAAGIKERYLISIEEINQELKTINIKDFLNYFYIKIGNIKLADLIYNLEMYFNCSTRQDCTNCLICYAMNYEPVKSVFISRVKNYIFKEYVIRSNSYELLAAAVKKHNFNKDVSKYNRVARERGKPEIKINDIKNLRLSEQGAIKNSDLKYIELLVIELNKVFKNLNTYTYSHDKKLIIKNVNINRSWNLEELKQVTSLKENVFINYSSKEELKEIIQHARKYNIKYVVCCTDCTRCSYCKSNQKHIIICKSH